MSFHFEQCDNPACRRPYLVEQFSNTFGDILGCGILVCPHCGEVKTGNPKLVYVTAPMLPEDEKQFGRRVELDERKTIAFENAPSDFACQWKPSMP